MKGQNRVQLTVFDVMDLAHWRNLRGKKWRAFCWNSVGKRYLLTIRKGKRRWYFCSSDATASHSQSLVAILQSVAAKEVSKNADLFNKSKSLKIVICSFNVLKFGCLKLYEPCQPIKNFWLHRDQTIKKNRSLSADRISKHLLPILRTALQLLC